MSVDIIIPIYNAYEYLRDCVESIEKHTDLKKHRLILIDDKSTDINILQYFDTLKNENIIKLKNEVNLGFSGTINKGIKYSNRDVIILNSDTIVTENWVELLMEAAYSDEYVGTVTPLTNNGTICSIPNFCEDNELPKGFSIDSYAKLVNTYSRVIYPEIPVAVGFCMYIKREVFNKIGYFDEKVFPRGYGEENDFCFRSRQLGYKDIICDNLFIYHAGTVSFTSQQKNEYCLKSEKYLNKKYPNEMKEIVNFVGKKGSISVNENINTYTKIVNGKRNILYFAHADFHKDADNNVGGTQLHIEDLKNGMIDEYNVFVLARDGEYLRLTSYIKDEENIDYKFYIGGPKSNFQFRNDNHSKIYDTILKVFNINILHVHHTYSLTFDIFYCAEKLGIPIFLTLHDFYYICPTIKMLDENNVYCEGNTDTDKCVICLENRLNIDSRINFIGLWREEIARIFLKCEEVFFPSEFAYGMYANYYDIDHIARVVEHGNIPVKLEHKEEKIRNEKLNIALIGGAAPEKGSEIFYDAIINTGDKYNWFVIGGIGDYRLAHLERSNLTKYGWYDRKDIPKILNENNIDIVCILSIWPETYCYTLSEAVLSGVPVVGTSMGAVGERIELLNCGWTVDVKKGYKDFVKCLDNINNHYELLEEMRLRLKFIKIKSLEEMDAEYLEVYNNTREMNFTGKVEKEAVRFIFRGYEFANNSLYEGKTLLEDSENVSINKEVLLAYQDSENELKSLKDSLSYKIIIPLQKVNFPMKRNLKAFILRIRSIFVGNKKDGQN